MPVLSLVPLSDSTLPIPGTEPWFARPGDPALSVMTDFRERASVVVSEASTIDAALDHMKHAGVRCAFVIEPEKRVVVGMITAYDISSEKPMRHMQSQGVSHGEVLVRDIMLPLRDWRVVDIRQIETATVQSVSRLFEASGLSHIAVVETAASGEHRLRGLLSGVRVKRLLSHA